MKLELAIALPLKYKEIMNRLNPDKQKQIIAALVEGNSIRATCRMTGAAKGTVLKLLAAVGNACDEYQDKALRNLTCKRIQCDEIWAFCYAKAKNVPDEHKGEFGYGDVWTFTAIDAQSKLIASWHIGRRDTANATMFMQDLAARLKNRVQLSTDGHKMYLDAVEDAFGGEIDFSQIVKIYGNTPESEVRYSPAECTGIEIRRIEGNADPEHVSTSYVERQM